MIFENLTSLPVDPIFGLNLAFSKDTRKNKVNLGVGVYRSSDLKPFILKTVKRAEAILFEEESSKEYLPIDGLASYVQLTKQLVFAPFSELDRIYGAQVVGGTAGLRIGSILLNQRGIKNAYIPDPTWDNHGRIFSQAGLKVNPYPYYDQKMKAIDFEGLIKSIDTMEENSLLVLHACCHNPTGCDLSEAQCKTLYTRIRAKKIFPFFDLAYQGFAENLESDTASIRLFLQEKLPCAIAVSHSKNFTLYAERIGVLFFVCESAGEAVNVGSHVKTIIRGLYSNPPCHGSRIVAKILENQELRSSWIEELAQMRERILKARQTLIVELQKKSSSFDHMIGQRGMFSYTGLSVPQVERLCNEYAIFMPKEGRINVAGLNSENTAYVAHALVEVL